MPDVSFARRSVEIVVARRLITAADIHKHGVQGRDLSASNQVALVEVGDGRGFLVKDLEPHGDSTQGSTLVELELYELARGRANLEQHLPGLVAVDHEAGVMILRGLTSARRLDQRITGGGPLGVPAARALGKSLGEWHLGAAELEVRPSWPWILDIDRENRLGLLDTDPQLYRLSDEIRSDGSLIEELDTLRHRWNPDTIIHGDMRFANILIGPSPQQVRFVDWESAGRGDSRWDVAGALQEFLSLAGSHVAARRRAQAAVTAFTEGYESAWVGRSWPELRPFVVWRVLLRVLQLANWDGDTAQAIHDHLRLARSLVGESELTFA